VWVHSNFWLTVQNLATPSLPLFFKEGKGEIFRIARSSIRFNKSPSSPFFKGGSNSSRANPMPTRVLDKDGRFLQKEENRSPSAASSHVQPKDMGHDEASQ
jgi:hypothetical protein